MHAQQDSCIQDQLLWMAVIHALLGCLTMPECSICCRDLIDMAALIGSAGAELKYLQLVFRKTSHYPMNIYRDINRYTYSSREFGVPQLPSR